MQSLDLGRSQAPPSMGLSLTKKAKCDDHLSQKNLELRTIFFSHRATKNGKKWNIERGFSCAYYPFTFHFTLAPKKINNYVTFYIRSHF